MALTSHPDSARSTYDLLVAKRDAVLAERTALIEQRAVLSAKLRKADRDLSDCKAAARLFDLPIDFPDDDEDLALRRRIVQNVRAHEGASDPNLAASAARLMSARVLNSSAPRFAGGGDASHYMAAQQPSLLAKQASAAPIERPPIRSIVLDQLNAAGPEGVKAADLRAYIERTFGDPIHEKTVGMTLYRLSQDGAVRRDGHTWFLVNSQKSGGAE